MKYLDCETHVTCDGQALDEYDVQVEGNVIECYVASESGKVCGICIDQLGYACIQLSTGIRDQVQQSFLARVGSQSHCRWSAIP